MKHEKKNLVDFGIFTVLLEKIEHLSNEVCSLRQELNQKQKNETVYTTIEAAALLKKSPKTIRRWIKDGILEAKNNGTTFLIYHSAMEKHLNPCRK